VCPAADGRPGVGRTPKAKIRGSHRGQHQEPDQAQPSERAPSPAQQGRALRAAYSHQSAVTAAETGAEGSAEQLRLAVKRIDKAAAAGVIHKNQAANRKSRLMKRVAKLEAAEA